MSEKKFVGTPKKVTTHVNQNEDLMFEKSSPGKKGYRLAKTSQTSGLRSG